MRQQTVVVAIVADAHNRFLVFFDPKWGGYTFSMSALAEGEDILGRWAIASLEHDLGHRLPNASAQEIEHISRIGVSGRTGEPTLYHYFLYSVDPGQTLDLLSVPCWNNNPPQYLTYEEITGERNDFTWSAHEIVRDFVQYEDVALAVITRAGAKETEYLLVYNESYQGYFFPAERVRFSPDVVSSAKSTVRADLGYMGPVQVKSRGVVVDGHYSPRFQRDRHYTFHIGEVTLPEVDLHQPGSLLEMALARRNRRFAWFPASALQTTSPLFSPTLRAIAAQVLQVIPVKVFTQPIRQSESAIALIQRVIDGKIHWLAQWNTAWNKFFFIGGHREVAETFRECVVREIHEELGLTEMQCPVAKKPAHRLEYRAISGSAEELTAYTMEVFEAMPIPTTWDAIAENSANVWLTEEEIRRQEARDARPISVTMLVVLSQAGILRRT